MNFPQSLSLISLVGRLLCAGVGIATFLPAAARGDVKMPSIFGDHMVLQQGMKLPVWGKADPGEKVMVSVGGAQGSATADEQGRWRVDLDPLPVSAQPVVLEVRGAGNTLKFSDVLIGDVWICSGQSNMAFTLGHASNASTEIPRANDDQFRLFRVARKVAYEPQSDCAGKWEICTPESAAPFSAIGYFFGREVQEKHHVPVGMIGSYVGGTPAQAWTSLEGLQAEPSLKPRVDEFLYTKVNRDKLKEQYESVTLPAWKKARETKKDKRKPMDPSDAQWMPTGLYNGMIAPLIPFTIKGVIWYQGANNMPNAMEYRTLFPAVIKDWRKQWGQSDFPFLFIQTSLWPNKKGEEYMPGIREAQLMTLSVPVTGMTVSIDLGDKDNAHFKNKADLSHRLFLNAEHVAYGKDLVYSGPIFKTMKAEGDKLRLSFDHTGSGLIIGSAPSDKLGVPSAPPASTLNGFAVAGSDMKFVPANAVIDGNTVVVSSDKVKQPVAVRYGWADAPEVNLYNKEGLPAATFRTDSLPLPVRDAKKSHISLPEE